MRDSDLTCIAPANAPARPLHAVRPAGLEAFLTGLPAAQARFLEAGGFRAAAQEVRLLPGPEGLEGAVLGLGDDNSPHAFGALAGTLPEGSVWQLVPGEYDPQAAVLGFCLGAYHYGAFRPARRQPARLVTEGGTALATARAIGMGRDLVNAPANLLGPEELAAAVLALAQAYGAAATIVDGAALEAGYPAVAAVGNGSDRAPRVASLRWSGSGAGPDAPLVALVGKGVCFDSGGYDLKPSSNMLRMKKDMGGAAAVLTAARLIMEADLPVRLAVRVGCVENSVSGRAMRPLDVLRTRRGLSVEVGNTDAEGRLVLCDLLADACEERPALLIDCATLTGAARAAVGPDLPALFCNDERWAAALLDAGTAVHDPLWRLPLWAGYDSWLESPIADVNNIAGKTHAGAIVGALFLQRFVAPGTVWAHIDLYAWNDATRPGRPEGGEVQSARAIVAAIERQLGGQGGRLAQSDHGEMFSSGTHPATPGAFGPITY